MNNIKGIFLSITAMLFFSLSGVAQLSGQEDLIRRRAAQKVAQMNDYISFMASKQKSLKTRQYYSKKALNLFMGEGGPYEENGVRKDGVKMEVTNRTKKTKFNRLFKEYFSRLISLGYSDVDIKSTEVADIKVSNLKKVDDNLYVCTCQYDQAFIGYRDGIPQYTDITTKTIKCYVSLEEVEGGVEYVIRLGDSTADETRPYPQD
ncbi:MAG: hypothetical protein K2M69_06765 [Muribaculaceae bacterium]|nr:hypothetical protein [Muribaculaceae bacterium]